MEKSADLAEFTWRKSCPVFIDAVGYSTSIEQAPEETRRQLANNLSALSSLIEHNNGVVIDTAGDGVFCEFNTVRDALFCMLNFQADINTTQEDVPVKKRMRFRCGISYGDVLQETKVISGPRVNIAARLQHLAEPGTVNIDGDAYREIEDSSEFAFTDLGFRVLKGMSNPVRVWRVQAGNEKVPLPSEKLAASYRGAEEESDAWSENARGIAVLPFEVPPGKDLSNEEDAYMALGLASDIADNMARSRWLKVISPRSSMNYSDQTYRDNAIAQELGVRYLLKGRIRKSGEAVRISAQLVDCPTGETVWSENFDRRDQSIFDIQDEIASLIVGKIEPEFLRHESQRASRSKPRNVTAWDLLMRARWHYWRGSRKHLEQARQSAEQALELEPDSSQVLALLSFCSMNSVWTGRAQDISKNKQDAIRYARMAVSRDEFNPNAHFTMGTAFSVSGEVRQAVTAQKRALELNPNFAAALGELSRMYALDRQSEEARRAALQAMELSPTDPHISLWVLSMGFAAFVEGDYKAAADFAMEAAVKRPDWVFHHNFRAVCEALNGDVDQAKFAFAESCRLLPLYPEESLRAAHPFTHVEDIETYIKGLRLAGWTGQPDA